MLIQVKLCQTDIETRGRRQGVVVGEVRLRLVDERGRAQCEARFRMILRRARFRPIPRDKAVRA